MNPYFFHYYNKMKKIQIVTIKGKMYKIKISLARTLDLKQSKEQDNMKMTTETKILQDQIIHRFILVYLVGDGREKIATIDKGIANCI
ncbi:hypothetical protein pb186bvf_017268 [Paramecium bursaria]